MSAESILRVVAERGLVLLRNGSNLRLEGPRSAIDPALIGLIRSAKSELIEHLRAVARDDGGCIALTPMQASYYYGRQDHFSMGGVSSHVYREIEGVFDAARLEAALAEVVERHGMLRTRFADDAAQVEDSAAECQPVRIAVADLRGLKGADQQAMRDRTRAEMAQQVLPANRSPLIEVRLTILGEANMILHVSHDGLVIDGSSAFLFFEDWRRAYVATDRPGLRDALQVSFFDYVRALAASHAAPEYMRARNYWLSQLEKIPPHPQLPLCGNPAAISAPVSVRHGFRIEPERWSALKAQAVRRTLTPNAVLVAAYAEVLSLWGAGERFTLNITLANRLPIHPDIDRVIGNFTDCMLLPIEIDVRADFAERAVAIQTRLREGLDHRQFSGLDVMREIGQRACTGQAVPMPFTFNSTLGAVPDGSAIAAWGREVYSVSQTPQVWLNAFALESDGALVIQMDSVDALFPAGLVTALTEGYERLLVALAAGDAAWCRIDQGLLPQDQFAQRRAANDTAVAIPPGQPYDRFLQHAAAAPDALAIDCGTRRLSYGELRAGACAVARWLKGNRIGRDDLVGVVMHKGWEQIVAILGVGLAGAAYVPIEAGLPAARLEALLSNGPIRCSLVQDTAMQVCEGTVSLTVDGAFQERAQHTEADTRPEDLAPVDSAQGDLAYVLYTSGSTGVPKGVMVTRRNLINLVADTTKRFEICAKDRFFAVSSCSFDLSVFDIFGALSVGAALVIPDAARAADPGHWLDLAARAGVTVWNSVPAIVGLLVDEAVASGRALPQTLRFALMSGDRIPATLPGRIAALQPDVRIVSLGGPTETTVWNILYPIDHPGSIDGPIPYGKPNANNRAYILDAQRRECPDWVPGELHAAGEGLANGYLGNPALTAAAFFDHEPLRERLYRTGDSARYRPDGNIEILGRVDFQIKLNGYRIDPAEIEAVLINQPGIAAAAVVGRSTRDGPRLVACLVETGDGTTVAECTLTAALEAALPEYMVPRQFVWLERLALTGNGKVDRAFLAQTAMPDAPDTATEAAPAPPTELEAKIIQIWSDILRCDAIDPVSGFYQLGGTSLSGVRLLARIRKEFGISVPIAKLPRLDTPRKMASHLDQAQSHVKTS
ncbi:MULTISPECIES: non-ribosomal peptide synthetase [unclassified Bradyrhizobium]|uniref:non-ribosomal peptide synthetase n=1 Tax=unclassified Bradyrhizobium TaxID=2631580 RepID=UPI001CD27C5C|nr:MULTISPECIES: non-ribosomal peptide synthetase [unclassified Bradyrhizobium]MCA1438361.1 amino acid adenylation domain-containing protein [Bradyrhizobium sp. BRP20]MCA1473114.1 amino acid adenylation domain-containing protein [Bradyrhizobium sp. IC3195]MCA1501921.1 amino acid adenylation domain-containing protein [Bradyrhizobium sp. NBAIM14]MCA1552347.1 amino acid adenylation domain-containing protein [Bradyrhizobium sp. BRP19]